MDPPPVTILAITESQIRDLARAAAQETIAALGLDEPRSEPGLRTVRQTAKAWQVSERTVRRRVARKAVASKLIGSRRLIPQVEIDRVIAEGSR